MEINNKNISDTCPNIIFVGNKTLNIVTSSIITAKELNLVLKGYYYGEYELARISDTVIEIYFLFTSSANDFYYSKDKIINAIERYIKSK